MSQNKPRPICPNGHTPDHFIAPFLVDENELPGAIHPDGEVCNSYYGGLYGVTAEDRAMIDEVESVFCPECLAEAKWQH